MKTEGTQEQAQVGDSLNRFEASDAFHNALSPEPPEGTAQTNEEENQQSEEIEAQEQGDHSEEQDQFEEGELSEEPDQDDPWGALIDIDGTERTAREWHDGFLQKADYTRKTQAVAEQRKQLTARETDVDTLQEKSAMVLGMITKQAATEVEQYRNVDWAKLLDSNQNEYMKHKAKYDSAKERLQNVQVEAQNFFQHIEQTNQTKRQQQANECVTELQRDIKGWNDDLYSDLIDYGMNKGINEQFLSSCVDPSFFKVLNKAKRFDNMKAVANSKKKKPVKSMQASRAKQTKVNPDKRKASIDKMRSSGGTRHDAASAFEDFI